MVTLVHERPGLLEPGLRREAWGEVTLEHGPVDPDRRQALLDWLDDGLRDGRRGRLLHEYAVSLEDASPGCHRVARSSEGAPLAHAMVRVVDVRSPEPIRVGLIGLVYTDPSARGRGLASRCIQSCVETGRDRGAEIVLLWSDQPEFYARMGFAPIGHEVHYRVDARLCRQARASIDARPLQVAAPRLRDWPILERLYARKTVQVERDRGVLRRAAAAPETRLRVARRGGRAIAYVAVGRGDDFRGVAHEWAGSPAGVLACLEALCAESGSLVWLRGPLEGRIDAALDLCGAPCADAPFALGLPLDRSRHLPEALYLWGFDSI